MSRSLPVAARIASSLRTTSISVSPPSGAVRSSQARNSAIAAPSRRCAARAPAISASVLVALGRMQGSRSQTTSAAPAAAIRSDTQAGALALSTATRPASASSAGPNASRRRHRDLGAEMRAHRVVALRRVGEEIDPRVGVEDGEGERHRGAGDVRAADVEQPGDGIGQRQHRRGEIPLHEAAGDLAALVGGLAPGERHRHAARSARRAAAAGRARPRRRGSPPAPARPAAGRAPPPAPRSPRAVCSQGSKPSRPPPGSASASQSAGLSCGMRAHLEAVGVHLPLHLQPVAPVDEDRRPVGGDDREPGRAGEARQPRQPLVARRHVLALVRVRARHQEGVHPRLRHRGPERRQARGAGVGRGPAAEVLQHGVPLRSVKLLLLAAVGGRVNEVRLRADGSPAGRKRNHARRSCSPASRRGGLARRRGLAGDHRRRLRLPPRHRSAA